MRPRRGCVPGREFAGSPALPSSDRRPQLGRRWRSALEREHQQKQIVDLANEWDEVGNDIHRQQDKRIAPATRSLSVFDTTVGQQPAEESQEIRQLLHRGHDGRLAPARVVGVGRTRPARAHVTRCRCRPGGRCDGSLCGQMRSNEPIDFSLALISGWRGRRSLGRRWRRRCRGTGRTLRRSLLRLRRCHRRHYSDNLRCN